MKPKPQLRYYQINAKNAVYAAFRSGKQSVLLQLQTGGGKSVIFSAVCNDVVARKRILLLVHRKELVLQAQEHLYKWGIIADVIMPDYTYMPNARVQVASVQTLVRRLEKRPPAPPDLIITDECHHAVASTYREIYSAFPNAHHLGVSATPCRTDGSGLDDIFQELILGPTVGELIANGHLVKPRVFASPLKFDLSRVKTVTGDYDKGQLAELMNKEYLIAGLVESWQKHAYGKRAVVFAVNVAHSEAIAELYRQAGIPAAHIDGTTPDRQRASILRRYAEGEILVLTNCDIVSEGYDVPAIECVQLAAPTQSLARYLQRVGRGLRPLPGKDEAIILDHADCVFTHGFPDKERKWTLQGAKKQAENTDIRIRDRQTGTIYTPKELPETVSDIELVEVKASDMRRSKMFSLFETAAIAGVSPKNAWDRFISEVQKPMPYEIDDFYMLVRQSGHNWQPGWIYYQKKQFGYVK